MHRGYLDQAIAFKREQSREQRSRGRRHPSQQDEWLERQRKEQREQSFSTYFNGANEGKAAADSAAQRRWERRRDSAGAVEGQEEAVEQKRRGWRKAEREVTAKITEQAGQPARPPRTDNTVTTADATQQPFASPSSSPPLVFSISSSPSSSGATVPARRRTWCRESAVELKAEDGEVVRLEPRLLQWDVEANKGPATCRRRVEAQLRGDAIEADYEVGQTHRRATAVLGSDERAEADEDGQTGEDTSAEVSYSGHALTSDDNHGLSNRSSQSSQRTSILAVSKGTRSATIGASDGTNAQSDTSRDPTPPLSPAGPPHRVPRHVTPLDFSSLFSSPTVSPAATPSAAEHPPATDSSNPATSQPAHSTDQAGARTTAPFGRRSRRVSVVEQVAGAQHNDSDEREADGGGAGAHARGAAWQISMELTPEEEQAMKQREDQVEREKQQAQQRREARAGRRAKRSTAPAASTSASTKSAEATSATTAAPRRPRPRRHTANDASAPQGHLVPARRSATAAAAATASAVADVVATQSLEDLQRSWDDLDQFLATELASLSSTAATRKHTRHSLAHDSAATTAATTAANPTAANDEQAEEDVDAIIDDFLSSTSASSSANTNPTNRTSQSHAVSLSAVSLPELPAGTELTVRVLTLWSDRPSAANEAVVSKVECYDDAGSVIHAVPLPAAAEPSLASLPTSTFSFSYRHRVSLIRLFHSETTARIRDAELRLDGGLIFRGELARDSSELLLFTRDAALLGRLLRATHGSSVECQERQQMQQQSASKRPRTVERSTGKHVVRVWRDGVLTICVPSTR